MLKRVEIENFRSCKHVVLDDLGPMTVLVGRNAVGKSNILRAISWLAETATSSARPPHRFTDSPRRVSLQIGLGRDNYEYSYSFKSRRNRAKKRPDFEIIETLDYQHGNDARKRVVNREGADVLLLDGQSVSIGSRASALPALVSVLPSDSEIVRLVSPLLRGLEAIRYYPLEPGGDGFSTLAVSRSEYNNWLVRNRGVDTLGTAVTMRLLDMELTRRDEFSEVQQLLGQEGLGVIDAIRVANFGPERTPENEEDDWYYIDFQPSLQSPKNSRACGFDDLSSGTQRLVAIVTSLIYDHSAVMLLEHPEDGIHRGLLRKLIGVLQAYSDESQLVIASHSPVVLEAIEPSAVRLVTMEDGQTSVRALTKKELRSAGRYLEEEGSLADFLGIVAGQ